MKRLTGRVVLITGAASDIGMAIGQYCSAEGAAVVCTDIDEEGVAACADALGENALGLCCDVTDSASVLKAVEIAREAFGRLDGVVHNAMAASLDGTVVSLEEAQWRREIDVCLTGAFLIGKHAIPLIEKGGGGSVVFIASTYGRVATRQAVAYCAAKAGVIHLARAIAVDHAQSGVRANSISPGSVKTRRLLDRWPDLDAAEAALAPKHLLGRIARAEEIATATVFLLSEEAAFITGSDMLVDGGFTAFQAEPVNRS